MRWVKIISRSIGHGKKLTNLGRDLQGQIRLAVDNVEDYISVFLKPVLEESARILKRGGTLALNLDDNLRTKTIVCKPALDIASRLPDLEFVGTAGLRKGTGFGQGTKDNTKSKAEPIYIWKKR